MFAPKIERLAATDEIRLDKQRMKENDIPYQTGRISKGDRFPARVNGRDYELEFDHYERPEVWVFKDITSS